MNLVTMEWMRNEDGLNDEWNEDGINDDVKTMKMESMMNVRMTKMECMMHVKMIEMECMMNVMTSDDE